MRQNGVWRLALASCGLLGACGSSDGECNTPVVEQCFPLAEVAQHCYVPADAGTANCPARTEATSCFAGNVLIDGPSLVNGSCCYHTQAMCE